MTLLLSSNGFAPFSCVSFPSSSSYSSSSSGSVRMVVTAAPSSRLSLKPTNLPPTSSVGFCVLSRPVAKNKLGEFGFRVSSDIADDGDSPSESDDDVLMDELQLDAKLQSKLEKKLKMKVAKNIRLRRKKLVHKRRLRKKGRWPPSKMKKLSNV